MFSWTGENTRVGELVRWSGLSMVLVILVGSSAGFLRHQMLWLDEATQMSGLSLGPVRVVGWLTGLENPDFGQYGDRMPPLSYWIGWAWSCVFGLNEPAMRWLGIVATAVAAALVYEAARQAFGIRSAWVAGLLFGTSPSVIAMSVEIRAYPFLLLGSAASCFFLVSLLRDQISPRMIDIVGLSVTLAATIATHFFGCVLAVCILSILGFAALRERSLRRTLLVVGTVVALAMAAVSPFIVRSVAMSRGRGGPDLAERARSIRHLFTSLISHETLSVYPTATIFATLATIILAALAIKGTGLALRPRRQLLAVLGLGLMLVGSAKFLTTKFDATASSYNLWMVPLLCLLLACSVSSLNLSRKRLATVASIVLVGAQASGVEQLIQHGKVFAHCRHGDIARLVRHLGTSQVAVIHDDPSEHRVFVYCPLRYEFGPGLEQYQVRAVARQGGPRVARYAGPASSDRNTGSERSVDEITRRYLIVVRSQYVPIGQLVRQVK